MPLDKETRLTEDDDEEDTEEVRREVKKESLESRNKPTTLCLECVCVLLIALIELPVFSSSVTGASHLHASCFSCRWLYQFLVSCSCACESQGACCDTTFPLQCMFTRTGEKNQEKQKEREREREREVKEKNRNSEARRGVGAAAAAASSSGLATK